MAYLSNIPIGSVAYASVGTNTTDAIQLWMTDIFVPANQTISTIGVLQGGTAGTDKILVTIYDLGGNLIANSATAGVSLSGANTFLELVLLTPTLLKGPSYYFIGVQGNGTAAGAIQTIPASTFVGVRANSVTAGSFGTLPSPISVPTSFVATKGPIVYMY